MKVTFLTRLGLAGALLLGATACEKDLLDQTNPNLPTTESAWKTSDDAVRASTACYAGLQGLGMYRRWLNFAFDLRDDIGFSQSPWGELADFTHFIQVNYDFEVSNNIWRDHYRTIFRCNQVLDKVPGIQGMDATLQKRVLAEARFLRALCYYNLASLYGNVPLVLATATDLNVVPPQGTEAQVWAQVISDLQAAQPDLPARYTGADVGRATQGAAIALLGKAYMQNHRWADAQAQFAKIIDAPTYGYGLTAAYTDNFRHTTENNQESIFEVQFSDMNKGGNDSGNGPDATSSQGGQRSQFWGIPGTAEIPGQPGTGFPGAGFGDGEVRPWVVREFLQEPTAAGQRDPRLAATVFYNRRDQTQFPTSQPIDADTAVYGVGFVTRYRRDSRNLGRVYWRKYQTDYYRTFEDFDSPINQRVIRYADILLLQAEALNEQNQTATAVPLINRVRQRAGLAPLSTSGFTRTTLHTQLMHERATELAGEGVRWFDLQRWGLLENQTDVNMLKAHDPDFNNFVVGKSRLLPLLQTEVDLNKLQQNPSY
ncbi:RagB/SusD family nutrient uptake outer membrane protein [Hymenobacter negativus]|uniref:RagB/SusD family nutrient uptake outer membrane protein n=1 Tax=Hymenobacter negativus TaxID=2795026 RepID=A0ABS3QJM7_9BACT|nr:RagB/SusD family nutrient uptake outer membrane protein [Hymenobacter negativus]MBO2011301.1 RagB/SusD family nutrient uptake outer membrane protein [Hymenobacter negativus]